MRVLRCRGRPSAIPFHLTPVLCMVGPCRSDMVARFAEPHHQSKPVPRSRSIPSPAARLLVTWARLSQDITTSSVAARWRAWSAGMQSATPGLARPLWTRRSPKIAKRHPVPLATRFRPLFSHLIVPLSCRSALTNQPDDTGLYSIIHAKAHHV